MTTHRQDTEWDTPPPGDVALKPGDVVDRGSEGQFIVVRISPSGANLRPLSSSKRTVTTTGGKSFEVTNHGRSIQVSKFSSPDLIVGFDIVRLTELLNRTKGTKMKLEPGDSIGLGGNPVMIYFVTETTAQAIVNRRLETIEREQNEFLLMDKPRKTSEERATALEEYLTTHKLTLEELTNNTKENEMKTAAPKKRKNPARGGLAVQANGGAATPHEAKKAKVKGVAKPKTGRSAYTRELAANLDLTMEVIHEKSKAKYPNSDMTTTKRLVEDERKNLEKAAKSKAKAPEAPAQG